MLEPGARLTWTVEASSHFEAMTLYYEHMGWGIYTSDFPDQDMQPYAERSAVDVHAQAAEWVRLRESDISEEHTAAAWADMPLAVWLDILDRYPHMAEWVAHAKRSPAEVAVLLAAHPDARVRSVVAAQRRLAPDVRRRLAQDPDEVVRGNARRFLGKSKPTDS